MRPPSRPAGIEREKNVDLRRILYGLHAILRFHFAHEKEQYLPLLEDGAALRPAS
jgi:hypothetical protein